MGKTIQLLVVVGPTASGKTSLGIDLAQRLDGEIICADSRTVYKDLDIGTAKPTTQERAAVPHHLLDIIAPDKFFTAAKFKQLAVKAIDETQNRGKLPIIVGGSGLYIDSVLYDYQFLPAPDPNLRRRLESYSVEQLQAELNRKGIPLPNNEQNPRHLIRQLETGGQLPARKALRPNTLIIGLHPPKEVLRDRVTKRAKQMVNSGLVEEVEAMGRKYGWQAPGLQSPAYKAFGRYIRKEISKDIALQEFIKLDLLLAKRQLTWFKRNNSIHWLDYSSNYVDSVTTIMNK